MIRAWFVVAILLVLSVFSFIDRISIYLMVDPIRQSIGIDDFQMGILQGPAFALFFLLGTLPMGWLVDKYSKRIIIYIGVTVWSIATIASGLSSTYFQLLFARSFLGLGEATLQPAQWSMMSKLFPKRKLAFAMSVLSAGAPIGAALSYVLGGFLLTALDSSTVLNLPFIGNVEPWQSLFLITGLPGLFIAFFIFLAPKETANPVVKDNKMHRDKLLVFVRENRFYLLCQFFGFGFLCAMVLGAAAWIPTYLQRIHGMSPKEAGLLLAVLSFPIGAIGMILNGLIVDKFFARGNKGAHHLHFSIVNAAIVIISILIFALQMPLPVIVIGIGTITFIQSFAGVAGASLQISTPEEFRGIISAAFIMFYGAMGMTVGPSFIAFLSDYIVGTENLGTAIMANYVIFGTAAAFIFWKGRIYSAQSSEKYILPSDKI